MKKSCSSFKPAGAVLAGAVALLMSVGPAWAQTEAPAKAASASAATGKPKAQQSANDKAMARFLGASSPSTARHAFVSADLNNDGVVSLDEFHKDIVKSWHLLDLDHDGEIARAELESIPDRGAVRAMLRLLQRSDGNGDQKLSFKELVEARMAFFDEADANHDDRLTLSEALEFDAKRAAKVAAPAAAKAASAAAGK